MPERISIPRNLQDLCWHLIDENDSKSFPHTDNYILLSFDNYTCLSIGRCEGSEEEGFTFYDGDDDKPLLSYGLIVNA